MVKRKTILAKEIVFFPHPYDTRWAIDLNRLLSKVFTTPFLPVEPPYMKSRSLVHALWSKMLPWMRAREEIKGIYLCNITYDFVQDVIVAGGVSENIWGFVHGSHLAGIESGEPDPKMVLAERAVYAHADGVFVASELMQRPLKAEGVEAYAIGLPLYGNPGKPRTSEKILWNHRLVPQKGYGRLVALPSWIRGRTTVSTPKGGPHVVPKVKPHVADLYYKPAYQTYLEIRKSSGYVLSLADHDPFGYAVLESVWDGMFAVAMRGENTAYAEFLPPEMLVDDPDAIPDKIAYYDAHPDKRTRLVAKAQEQLDHLRADRWVRQMLMVMGVER